MAASSTLTDRTKKGAATRERIVETAAQLIVVNGVARTTLDDVGAEAGVGRSQLYHYFGGKSDLVQAVIARYAGEVFEHRGPRFPVLGDWSTWWAWRDAMIAGQQTHLCVGGCPLGSLVSELSDLDEVARRSLEVIFVEWKAHFRGGLNVLKAEGHLAVDLDLERLATLILAGLEGGLLLTQLRRDTAPLEDALDSLFTLLGAPHRRDDST